LKRDTDALITSLTQANRQLRFNGSYSRDSIDGRAALRTTLSNVSEATGQNESVSLTTTRLTDWAPDVLHRRLTQSDASTIRTCSGVSVSQSA
jgi:hypothetical protein